MNKNINELIDILGSRQYISNKLRLILITYLREYMFFLDSLNFLNNRIKQGMSRENIEICIDSLLKGGEGIGEK